MNWEQDRIIQVTEKIGAIDVEIKELESEIKELEAKISKKNIARTKFEAEKDWCLARDNFMNGQYSKK